MSGPETYQDFQEMGPEVQEQLTLGEWMTLSVSYNMNIIMFLIGIQFELSLTQF